MRISQELSKIRKSCKLIFFIIVRVRSNIIDIRVICTLIFVSKLSLIIRSVTEDEENELIVAKCKY